MSKGTTNKGINKGALVVGLVSFLLVWGMAIIELSQ